MLHQNVSTLKNKDAKKRVMWGAFWSSVEHLNRLLFKESINLYPQFEGI